jgi:hypothetical protein
MITEEKAKELISALRKFICSSENSDDENAPVLVNLLQDVLSQGMGVVTKSIEVSKITEIPQDVLFSLKPGDMVIKKTGDQRHSYRVSYKDEVNGGICLTYSDASVVETVSYDLTDGTWVYNSTDSTSIGG